LNAGVAFGTIAGVTYRWVLASLLGVGCGRVGFDERADGSIAARFCATRPEVTFCEDFDAPGGAMGWDSDPIQTDITYEQPATSPPLAMHITMPPSTTSCLYRRLDRQASVANISTVHLEWAFSVSALPSDISHLTIAQLGADGMPGVRGCVLLFLARPGGTSQIYEQDISLNDTFFGPVHDLAATIEADRYVQADLVMTLGSSPRFTLMLDGVPQLVDMPMQPECAGTATVVRTNMGIHCRQPATAATDVRLDDIAVTFGP
jgi:hypothetical protein